MSMLCSGRKIEENEKRGDQNAPIMSPPWKIFVQRRHLFRTNIKHLMISDATLAGSIFIWRTGDPFI